MRVPMLDIRRQNEPLAHELREACDRVLRSGAYILGEEVERFEEEAAAIAGARFAIGVSSGTDALLAALMALGIGPGDEVICPAFTFFATAGSIARLNARPMFADSRRECFNIDPGGIESLITPRTKAIIPVHLYGQPADMDEILSLARRRRIKVIEDAAQAFGALYRGRPVGALGDFGAVSFYPTKNLGGFGDAGLLLTNDPDLASRARLLRNHGAERQYFHATVGGNFRLDAIQAALLAVKLPRLADYTARRQAHAGEYRRRLDGIPGLELPDACPDRTHIFNQFTVRAPGRRGALREFLAGRGIATAIYYPVPLHRQECFAALDSPPLPVAEGLAADALSLPVFPEMTGQEHAAVIEAIAEFYGQ